MSLRFMESFDHHVTADLTEKWTTVTGSPTISAGNGRRSTACLRTTTQGWYLTKTLDAQATWIVGVAFRASAAFAGTAMPIIQLLDAGTLQCDVRINSDGTISVTRNATVLGTSVFALSTSVWYYIEFKCLISDASGTYEVRVDGSNKVSGTGADTKNTANNSEPSAHRFRQQHRRSRPGLGRYLHLRRGGLDKQQFPRRLPGRCLFPDRRR